MPKNASGLSLVSPATSQIVSRVGPQLECVNQKIADLVMSKPHGQVRGVFALAAHLAGEAIEVATELQHLPGIDAKALRDPLNFWHRVRDYTGTAALNCAGGNQTLAEALITFQFLRNAGLTPCEEPRTR